MEAKKSSSKQVVAILLLVIGLAAGVFGVLGLVGGGGTDPYEARKSVVMVYVLSPAYRWAAPPVPWALVLPSGNPANRWNIL